MTFAGRSLVCLGAFLAAAGPLWARPPHKKALADHFGPFLARHLNDCRTCHLPDSRAEELGEEKPHNPFGARLKEVRKELNRADRPADIVARLQAVAAEDSDGDGTPNLIELLAGHNPGEASSSPSPAEVARANRALAAFRSRKVYTWKPFEPVERPPLPQVKNRAWIRNPIDAFVAEQHELFDLKPRPEAPRAVLLRRVYLDLVGLPPTRQEMEQALADRSPDWYEKVVDRLLASPEHGERWARHWMDVWRYVDYGNSGLQDGWTGAPNMWRWRDWIVASLQADRGYDRMVQQMLAADELADSLPADLAATAFLARNKSNNRDAWLHDSVNHTARAFLGVTMECARCHQHMYDPIPQVEYYRLRAVFEPLGIRVDPVKDPRDDPKKPGGLTRVYDQNPTARTYLYIRGVEQNPDKTTVIEPGVPQLLQPAGFAVAPVSLPVAAYAPHRHQSVIEQSRHQCQQEIQQAQAELAALAQSTRDNPLAQSELALCRLRLELAQAKQTALEKVLQVEVLEDGEADKNDRPAWESAAQAADAAQRQVQLLEAKLKQLAARQELERTEAELQTSSDGKLKSRLEQQRRALADADKALAKAEEAAAQPPSTNYKKRGSANYPRTSSGRRLALARWITSPANPLAARVAVNHIWLRHFGTALVPSVFDFGAAGLPPTHPALLDWLAAEFMHPSTDAGKPWSMKRLHRLIVTSQTYRMSSTPDRHNLEIDPENQFLWRMSSRRMEAEVVRDSILHVAGNLDLSARGGPELDPKQGNDIYRRSLWFRYTEGDYLRFLEFFDVPNVDDCYRRSETIVPQQALTLLNSELALAQARLLARKLSAKTGADEADFVQAAFATVLSRPATTAEIDTCLQFLAGQTAFFTANRGKLAGTAANPADGSRASADPALRARENLVHLLFNHNDFVTVR